jgi:hypothetical protein
MAQFAPSEHRPKPTLARWLELLASMLELRDGRLELIFRDGRLEAYLVDGGMQRPAALGRFDGLADELLQRVRDVAPMS